MIKRLSSIQLDALKEIGTIGAGNAATSISKLIGKRVDIRVPLARVLEVIKIPEAFGGPELPVAAIYFEVSGKATACAMLVFSMDEALKLSDILTGKPVGAAGELDEITSSALKELGNISIGSYLTALSEIVKMKFTYSVPFLSCDMLQAVLDGILIALSLKAEEAIALDTEFVIENVLVRGHFLFMTDPDGSKTVLDALGM